MWKKFVIRCSASSFRTARQMLQGEGEADQIATLTPTHAMNPTVNRPERKVPRKKISTRQRLNYFKRRLKMCF